MARLTIPDAGRIALAKSIKARTVMMAVGSGSVDWGLTPPDPDTTATALTAPLAIVRHRIKEFVRPDPAGAVMSSDGSTWTITATPTQYLYLSFTLGFTDGPDETLRECAIYLDPVIQVSVPNGQNYIPAASVTAFGDLLALKRFSPDVRAGVELTIGEIITL